MSISHSDLQGMLDILPSEALSQQTVTKICKLTGEILLVPLAGALWLLRRGKQIKLLHGSVEVLAEWRRKRAFAGSVTGLMATCKA